jgi:hypothetical protein
MNWRSAGSWLLPFACLLCISATVAYAADLSLTRPLIPDRVTTQEIQSSADVSPPPQLGPMLELPDSVIHADQPIYTRAAP